MGLRINDDKTKSMAVADSPLHLRCDNQDIEQVLEFEYLGSTVLNAGSTEKDTSCRIGQASGTFNRLKLIWRSQNFSLRLKLRLFNSNVIPVLLYASDTWHLNNTQKKANSSFREYMSPENTKHPLVTKNL
ncbi:uncharacterized protein LOC136040693 [Artemia franciscana]|uniref:uncharacterized protein LOC136040693 n=1 Tax=Artemia franciscana TaxID=6661 RepID=UPI0032DA1DA6